MTTPLARPQSQPQDLVRPVHPIDTFQPLDKYAGGLSHEAPRVPWLATISAGYLDTSREPPIPRASRQPDQKWIHMAPDDRARAPGLYQLLEAGAFRTLEIAVASDQPEDFLQQRFEQRTATRLVAYGDEHQITEIVVREVRQNNRTVVVPEPRRVYHAGSPEYAEKARQCNVVGSFFFVPARWKGNEPSMFFPDGLGVYRLRFTSRNSLREIMGSLRQLSNLTSGRLAGLPLRLTLDWREVADPTGTNRTIGVWSLRFVPPSSLELTPRIWRDLASSALAEGETMRLPVPNLETVEDAADTVDVDLDAPTAPQLRALKSGPPCDQRFYQQAWFARVKGSPLDSDDARATFIHTYTEGRFDSLSAFLQQATEGEAAGLLSAAGAAVQSARSPEQVAAAARRYDEIFGPDDAPLVSNAAGDTVDRATGEVLDDGLTHYVGDDCHRDVAPAPEVDPEELAEALEDNRRLLDGAESVGVKGRQALTARREWSLERILGANAELRARIESREGERATVLAGQAELPD
jgi:hypothetical protein